MSDIANGPDVTEGDAPATSTFDPAMPDEFDLDKNWTGNNGIISFGDLFLTDAASGAEIVVEPDDTETLEQLAVLRADWASRLDIMVGEPDEDTGYVPLTISTGLLDPDDVIQVIWDERFHFVDDSEHGVCYLVSVVPGELLEDYPGCGRELTRLGFVIDGLPDPDDDVNVYYVTKRVPDDMPLPDSATGETLGAAFTPEDQIGLE